MKKLIFRKNVERSEVEHKNGERKASVEARMRFKRGLAELNLISSPSQLSEAKLRGVEITIEGFRERVGIGNTSMRETNSDLFELLKKRLTFLGKMDTLNQPKLDEPKEANESKKSHEIQKLEAKVRTLNAQLDVAHQQIKRLMTQLQEARMDYGLPPIDTRW